MKTLKFNIYDEFACTGPICEDSCCKHWQINLTRREYLDYKKMECSPELKSVVDSAFKRLKDGNDQKFAMMVLKEDGSCPFLGEDRLCMLQKEKGESVLTIVCSSYPRNWFQAGKDAAVFTLTPTCYHVVELLMKHPEGLALTEEEYDRSNKWINRNLWSGALLRSKSDTYPYIWSIKTAQLDILQNRDFTIAERLLILGYYTQKVCDYLKNTPEKIEQLGAMMLDQELCRRIADSLKTPQTEAEAAAKSIDILYNMSEGLRSGKKGRTDPHTILLLNRVADDLELGYAKKEEGLNVVRWNSEKYDRNREMYRKIEEERPYLIENLLAITAFSRFSKDGEELWADYFSLAVLYNFMKIGTAVFLPENYTDTELAMAVTNIVKLMLNANLAKGLTMQDFARNNSNTLPYVAFLIS